MSWQDTVLTMGGLLFIIALIPSLLSEDKPAFATSLLTGTILLVYAGVFLSLSLIVSGISNGLLGVVWIILAFQRHKRGEVEYKRK